MKIQVTLVNETKGDELEVTSKRIIGAHASLITELTINRTMKQFVRMVALRTGLNREGEGEEGVIVSPGAPSA